MRMTHLQSSWYRWLALGLAVLVTRNFFILTYNDTVLLLALSYSLNLNADVMMRLLYHRQCHFEVIEDDYGTFETRFS